MPEKIKRFARKIRSNQQGFTLVELMVVVIILGVLAGVAAPQYLGRAKDAKINATMSTLQAMKGAIGVWAEDKGDGEYPVNESELETAMNDAGMAWSGSLDGFGKSFVYRALGAADGTKYLLFSYGADGAITLDDEIVCTNTQQPMKDKDVTEDGDSTDYDSIEYKGTKLTS